MHTGPGVFNVRPRARARAERAAVLLGLVVVMLLGVAAPAFAHASDERGDDHGRDDRPPALVDEVRGNVDPALPRRDAHGPGSAPAAEPPAPPGAAVATAARAAAPARAVPAVAEVPSALAASAAAAPPAADLPVAAPPAAAPAVAPAPLPTAMPDELPASAPPLAPPAAVVAPSGRAVSAPTAAPSSPPASGPDRVPPAQIDDAPPPAPPAGDVGREEQRAAPTGTAAERSFTALLVLIAAALLFLAVQGRIDRRDPRRIERPGEFRRFR